MPVFDGNEYTCPYDEFTAERARLHKESGGVRPADWKPTPQVRGTACQMCGVNDYAMFYIWQCRKKRCMQWGGCGVSTHVRDRDIDM